MVQGTSSGAGKSTLVAGFCRLLARRGTRVAPFKPQNMSLNSAVASDGGEIGRAQALQAQAARTPALTDMNPVLIKPVSDSRAQIVVCGRPHAELDASAYQDLKSRFLGAVLDAFARLRGEFEVVIVEGAGSPAEVNLRANDIANMGFAEAADCPVLLLADIDRGGVFAQIVGTLECLSHAERARVIGFVINRFRGARSLLAPGLDWIEARTGKPVLGVLPYLEGLALDAEDALPERAAGPDGLFRVAVPVYPRISNHTDFDPLRLHPEIELRFVGPGEALPDADLVVLPGSKSVRADLDFLESQGWAGTLLKHLRYGGKLVAICGGMQMLGRWIHDPAGIEGVAGSRRGLGLLEFDTVLSKEKRLQNVEGVLFPGSTRTAPVSGYEIHMGVSKGRSLDRPAAILEGRPDGALSDDGQILATYAHGLFDRPEACAAILAWAGLAGAQGIDLNAKREASLERLADSIERELNLDLIMPYLRRG